MGATTGIAWTEATWNPIRGCSKVSAGCDHCYAMHTAYRFAGEGQPYEGLATRVNGRPAWTNRIAYIREHLADPLRWTRPRRIFVNSTSDLFHPGVDDEYLAQIFAIMALAPQHTFQVLTKRPERMASWVTAGAEPTRAHVRSFLDQATSGATAAGARAGVRRTLASLFPTLGAVTGLETAVAALTSWPLPHVWLGVSVEDQKAAVTRIPHLLATPAAVRFLSCEPLLGPVTLDTIACRSPYHHAPGSLNALTGEWWPVLGLQPGVEAAQRLADDARIAWLIVGGESGPGARGMDPDWADDLRRQCASACVPFFFKQAGAILARTWRCTDPKGEKPAEWPAAFRVQDYPVVRAVTYEEIPHER